MKNDAEIPVGYCQRCGAGPLFSEVQIDYLTDNGVTCDLPQQDFDYEGLCTWCGNVTEKSKND